MAEASSDIDPLDALADSFLESYRRGERPGLEEYAACHPELAERIRELFPALVALEACGPIDESSAEGPGPSAAPPDEMPRRLGDYRIVREVGRGGMGVVYEAVQESLGRRVALKVLPFHGLIAPTHRERFRREAAAAAKLHHTNIVPVFGVGECGGVGYYAMQFIEGQGLDAVLDELRRLRGRDPAPPADPSAPPLAETVAATVARALVGGRFATGGSDDDPPPTEAKAGGEAPSRGMSGSSPPPVEELLRPDRPSNDSTVRSHWSNTSGAPYYRNVAAVGVQVAEALDYAHAQGILHRDIKPSNLLLDTSGAVWVADFGLAKAEGSDELTRPGDVVGTSRYMAPERFHGRADRRSEVYSVGITLYELLTLRPAFEDSHRGRLIERVQREEPPRPRVLDRRIPRDLETIVLKAIAKEPARRYATARELAQDLQRFLDDRPIRARRTTTAERAWRWCHRNPWLAVATGLAAGSLVAVAALSLFYARTTSGLLAESNRRLAIRNFERGLAAFEKDQFGPGLLWTVESWRSASAAGHRAWQHAARANVSAWAPGHPRLRGVFSHARPIVSLAVSPDGRTLVTASEDNTARIWDLATGEPIGRPLAHDGSVGAVAFSPDGRMIVTGSYDHKARLWDAATGRPVGQPMEHGNEVRAVAFSPDGKTLLICGWDSVRLWDLTVSRPLGTAINPPAGTVAAAFSPDGRWILTGSELRAVGLWEAATGRAVGSPLIHPKKVMAVAFSPGGESFATGCGDGKVRFWDTATRTPVGEPLVHQGTIRVVAFGPDGRTILAGSEDRTARLWDTSTRRPLGPAFYHQGPIEAGAFTPDGRSIVTAGGDYTARLWDVAFAGSGIVAMQQGDSIHAVAFGPDGKSLLTGSHDRSARLWDAATGRPLGPPLVHPGEVWAVALSPNGRTALTGCTDNGARLWDLATGKPIGRPLAHDHTVNAVAFSPDGRTIVTGSQDNRARLWDAATGQPIGKPLPHDSAVDAVAFGPDGRTFLTGCAHGSAQLWDAATGRPIGPPFPHPGAVSAVALRPDGEALVVGGEDGTARQWDVATRQPLGPALEHRAWIYAIAFSPDGRTILTGSWDHTARLWDAATGQPIGPPLPHRDRVWAVAFSPDGRSVLTGSDDRMARLFRMAPELPDDLERVATWVEVLTGLTLDAQEGSIQVLDNATWLARRQRLRQLGGPPDTRPRQ